MEEVKKDPAGAEEEEKKPERHWIDEMVAKNREANEIISQGKGRLKLENPILAGDTEVTELEYDFTVLTGMEYTDAMDSDPTSSQIYRITYRQGLALFAKAVAKQMDQFDMRDIVERIGVTDAVEGVQLASLFFNASTRAGRLRILKK